MMSAAAALPTYLPLLLALALFDVHARIAAMSRRVW
jgi:hypothetical protein